MKVKVIYLAQKKKAASLSTETIEFDETCTVQDFVTNNLCERHQKMKDYIYNADGSINETILLFIKDTEIKWRTPEQLNDGDEMTIMSPIMGG
jgi:molybdopterin converting factor small subunit